MDDLLIGYIEDLKDYTITFNEALFNLESDYEDKEVINTIFRVAHTIKGNSAAMQFTKITEIMHTMEDILHEIRESKRKMDAELVALLYACHDFLEDCMSLISNEGNDEKLETAHLLVALKAIKLRSLESKETISNIGVRSDLQKSERTTSFPFTLTEDAYEIILENIRRGLHLIHITIVLRQDTEMKTVRNIIILRKIQENGFLLDSIPTKKEPEETLSEDFHFDHIQSDFLILSELTSKDYEKILGGEMDIDSSMCNELIEYQIIDIYAKELINQKAIESIEAIQLELLDTNVNSIKNEIEATSPKTTESNDFVRISAQKVDAIVEMLGELIIFNSQVEQYAYEELSSTDKTRNILPKMSKLIKNIQDLSMTMRMVSIKPILHKLTRIVRDTSAELGKKVVVILEGDNTEIDKGASEKIFDPLMHIVRNAVAHGIEKEETREKRGKKPEGTIRISAYNKRNQVYIEVSDDGGGIDPQVIYNKAKENKLVDESKVYTEDEIIRFIFKPGFSTQEKIDSVSGRGVGMNVVESEINKLRGKVEIINEVGVGCTFIIKIPMNLAVLNGTIIEMEGNRFIIPTLFIKQFFIIQPENWITMQGVKQGIRVRESIIPIVSASKILDIKEEQDYSQIREMVILELEQKFIALPVNQIIGRQEIVAKPLNEIFARTEIFSGSSILGDGRVTMILDVEALFKLV